jgi:hypothetical protein
MDAWHAQPQTTRARRCLGLFYSRLKWADDPLPGCYSNLTNRQHPPDQACDSLLLILTTQILHSIHSSQSQYVRSARIDSLRPSLTTTRSNLRHGRQLQKCHDQPVSGRHQKRMSFELPPRRILTTDGQNLQFLVESNVITAAQQNAIQSQLPVSAENSARALPAAAPTQQLAQMNIRNEPTPSHTPTPAAEKKTSNIGYYSDSMTNAPPPAYPSAPSMPVGPSVLTYASAMYQYNAQDAGDLALLPNDKIAVTEYMNAEWWKGKNERTGQEGIFPASYVRKRRAWSPPVSRRHQHPATTATCRSTCPTARNNRRRPASRASSRLVERSSERSWVTPLSLVQVRLSEATLSTPSSRRRRMTCLCARISWSIYRFVWRSVGIGLFFGGF